jgi:HK97 gp10 family phage protein
MTRSFSDLASFQAHMLEVMSRASSTHGRHALRTAATIVWREARGAIGQDNWQPGPPFLSPWPDLAISTEEEKDRLGFTGTVSEYDSLLRTGKVRDSIKWKVHKDNKGFSVGSDDPVARYLELGTKNMPPRSFIGGALARTKDRIVKRLGEGLHNSLLGEGVHEGAMDIEGEDH